MPHDPKALLLRLFYGYTTGLLSSRKLERATYVIVGESYNVGNYMEWAGPRLENNAAKHLIIAYRALFPDDQRTRSSRSLLIHLETLDPAVFGNHNLFKSNGDKYYHLF